MRKSRGIPMYLTASLIILCLFDASGILAADKHSADVKAVTAVLEQYKMAIDKKSFALQAPCSVPPMDKSVMAMQHMHEALARFADAFAKAWGKNKAEGIDLEKLSVNPLSYITDYKYKNIRIEGDVAYADTELTVNGQEKKSIQHLARINGRWYITQKSGPPDYSPKDREKIIALAKLTQELADFTNSISSKIESGKITQAESLQAFRDRLALFQKQVKEIKGVKN